MSQTGVALNIYISKNHSQEPTHNPTTLQLEQAQGKERVIIRFTHRLSKSSSSTRRPKNRACDGYFLDPFGF